MIGIIITITVLAVACTYVILLYLNKVKDDNKNFIPDSVEDVVGEISKRVDAVAEEISEAIDAAKGKKKK